MATLTCIHHEPLYFTDIGLGVTANLQRHGDAEQIPVSIYISERSWRSVHNLDPVIVFSANETLQIGLCGLMSLSNDVSHVYVDWSVLTVN